MDVDGEKLRRLRESRFLTQVGLAKSAGMTESTINRLERGLQQARISTVRKLASALEVEPAELLGDKERAHPEE